jgi:outer membrane protein assembly factor BamB
MTALLLALALAAQPGFTNDQPAPTTHLPPPSVRLWQVAWNRQLVPPRTLEWKSRELGGPAVDPVTGYVVTGTRDGFLHAYDPDGGLVWTFKTGARFDAAPRIEGDTVYVGSNDGTVYALDVASGKERWKYAAQEEVGTTPVVAGDVVLAMTLQDTLIALDARTGAWKWHHRRESREGFTVHGAAAALVSDRLALGAYSDGTVAALDLATGVARWERKVAPAGDFMDVDALRVQSNRLFVAAYSGAVYALDVLTGQQLWELRTPTPTRLALGGGVLVAVTTTQVLGIAPQDGTLRWGVPLEGAPGGEPVVANGKVAVPNQNSLLWLDVATGRVLRKFDPGTGVSATPAVSGRRVYVLSNAGNLVALDLS